MCISCKTTLFIIYRFLNFISHTIKYVWFQWLHQFGEKNLILFLLLYINVYKNVEPMRVTFLGFNFSTWNSTDPKAFIEIICETISVKHNCFRFSLQSLHGTLNSVSHTFKDIWSPKENIDKNCKNKAFWQVSRKSAVMLTHGKWYLFTMHKSFCKKHG